MNKSNKLISRFVVISELRYIITAIDEHNFGYAKKLINEVVERIAEFDETPVPACLKCRSKNVAYSIHCNDCNCDFVGGIL